MRRNILIMIMNMMVEVCDDEKVPSSQLVLGLSKYSTVLLVLYVHLDTIDCRNCVYCTYCTWMRLIRGVTLSLVFWGLFNPIAGLRESTNNKKHTERDCECRCVLGRKNTIANKTPSKQNQKDKPKETQKTQYTWLLI